ncbi:MAG: MoaD/ThiS family protein [bacterium]
MFETRVRILLRGHLWRYAGAKDPEQHVPWQQGKSLAQVLEELGIPREEVMLALVDGKSFPLSECPKPGQKIEILPVLNGG